MKWNQHAYFESQTKLFAFNFVLVHFGKGTHLRVFSPAISKYQRRQGFKELIKQQVLPKENWIQTICRFQWSTVCYKFRVLTRDLPKKKDSFYLPFVRSRQDRFMPFLRTLAWRDYQIASSKIWTELDSISVMSSEKSIKYIRQIRT